MHFNVITPLDHIIVSDFVSHFLVNSAEVLCNQAAFALKSNPPTTIQQSTEMSLFGFWPFKHGVLFLLKQRAFLFIAALMQLNACRHVFFFHVETIGLLNTDLLTFFHKMCLFLKRVSQLINSLFMLCAEAAT